MTGKQRFCCLMCALVLKIFKFFAKKPPKDENGNTPPAISHSVACVKTENEASPTKGRLGQKKWVWKQSFKSRKSGVASAAPNKQAIKKCGGNMLKILVPTDLGLVSINFGLWYLKSGTLIW